MTDHVRTLAIDGAAVFEPPVHADERGRFWELFNADAVRAVRPGGFEVAQVNRSVSRRGVIRGVHVTAVPPGQAKYVACVAGVLLDVVVDLRVGSPTFGAWDAVRLDPEDFRAVYVPEGLGHAFVALEDDTVISYLCSTSYNPAAEHGISPLDPALGLPWPADVELTLSPKDEAAPTLADAVSTGLLPDYADCLARYRELKRLG